MLQEAYCWVLSNVDDGLVRNSPKVEKAKVDACFGEEIWERHLKVRGWESDLVPIAISISDLSFDLILISKEFVGIFDISVFKEFEDLSRGDFLAVDTKR